MTDDTPGRMSRQSAPMLERRRRILAEARSMIAESGLEGLNIRELAERSRVVHRTIYNAFGSKENLLGFAIQEYFDDFDLIGGYLYDSTTIDGVIERLFTATSRNQQNLNWLRVVVSLYFSLTVEPTLRNLLLDVGRRMFVPALRDLRMRGQIEKGVDIDRLSVNLSNIRVAILHEWSIGLLSDSEFFNCTIDAVLTMLAGATRGDARRQIRAWLADFKDAGPASEAYISAARARLPINLSQHAVAD